MKLTKSLVAFAVAASFNHLALADDISSQDMEVITVKGDFRQTNLQKTASSLSVLSADDIELRNAQNLEEMVAMSANVNFASGSQRARYYQIRGIGERSQFQEPINPSVGLVIDDIDFSSIGSIASMFDVAQTEIFRGPQGTRFGANAMAGLINITTNAPTEEFEGSVRASLGNYDSYGLALVLSGPATDKVNYRIAAEKYESDGFMENDYLDSDDTNNRDELSLRGKLAIAATDELTIDLTVFHFDFDNGYDAFSLDNNRHTFSDNPGFDRQETTAISSKFTYTGIDTFSVTTILSYADSDLAYGYDEDWAYGEYEWNEDDWDNGIYNPDPCITPTGCFADVDGYSSTDYYFRDRKTSTAEIRLSSNEKSRWFDDSTAWVAGVYFKQDDEDLVRQYTYLDSDFSSAFDTETFAAFIQLDSQLTDKLMLTSGLRVESRSADYINSSGLSFDPSDTMVGGKLVLAYQQTQDTLIYGSINRGYKAGGVNTDGSLPDNLREFDPEYLWNYEIGYKVSLLENQAFVRASAFYMDRKDIQVKSSKDLLREDGSSEFITYLGNAAEGHNQGVEIEAAWQVSDSIEIYSNIGLLDTEFNNFTNDEGESLSGRDQAHAPQYQYHAGINFTPNQQWLLNVSIEGKDEYYFSDSHDEKSDSVNLVNASLVYYKEDYQVKLWARNLLDEDYQSRGFRFGNDPRDGYTSKAYYQLAEPAVFGVTLDYNF